MTETIEIEVCDIHGDIHSQLSNSIEEYDEAVRNQVEDMIHEFYQQAERAKEENEKRVQMAEQQQDE